MGATAWRKALHFFVTVKRGATSRSPSGSTTRAYSVVAAGVKCSVQEGGGRMTQDDLGQAPRRTKSVLFGEEVVGVVQQGDLLVQETVEPGRTYKVVHVHVVPDPNAPHVEARVESWPPAGGD